MGDNMENTQLRKKEIYKVTLMGSAVNLLLSTGKLAAGIIGQSGAMIADAIHSLSDFITDMVVLVFVKVSSRPKDASHDFGHGKFETLATVIIGVTLFGVAIGILNNSYNDIRKVIDGQTIGRPGLIALIAAAVSIVTKELLYRYTVVVGRKEKSPVLIANAWHHRSDAFSSIGTLIGIGGAYFLGLKWRVLDPLAAIIVAILIIKVSYDLVVPGLNELLEKSLPKSVEDEIMSIITVDGEVRDPHNLKTRQIGAGIAVEAHIRVDPKMTVEHSHAITVAIEHRLKERFGQSTHVIIHTEPAK